MGSRSGIRIPINNALRAVGRSEHRNKRAYKIFVNTKRLANPLMKLGLARRPNLRTCNDVDNDYESNSYIGMAF